MWNFLAMYWKGIGLATIAAMIVGFVWYAKPVFGKKWQELVGLKDKDMKQGMFLPMLIMLLVVFITACVLMRFIVIANPTGYVQAIKLAIWVWLGFVATYAIGGGMFEKRPPLLIAINIANSLVTLVVMAAILYALQ